MNLEELRTAVRRGGVEPTPRELAETLWLAAEIQRREPPSPTAAAAPPPARHPPPPGPPPRAPRPVPPHLPPPEPPEPVELHALRPPVTEAREARIEEVPKPIALADRLAFQRALRPLLRRVPVPGLGTLDEEATADHAAEHPVGARWPAVLRAPRRLWLDAVVVVDDGDSMAIWRDLAADIVRVLHQSGVFRQVYRHRLQARRGPAGGADGAAVAEVTDWQGRPVPPRRLIDPVNRRVTFVVSDGVGKIWRSGSAGAVLGEWARRGPVSILQPLPERMWARTWTRTVAGTLSAPRPCVPNSDLSFAAFGGRAEPEGTLVPVLQVDHRWLRRWTALVAGGPSITAAVTGVGEPPGEPVAASAGPLTPDQRVRHFRAAASGEAFQLARYVALSDPHLDLIRYVQQAMFTEAQPAHLAEVLLSGLLRVEDSRRGRYRFVDGVQEVLTATLSVSETIRAHEMLDRVSAAVSRRMTADGARFPALTPGDGDERLAVGSKPFAITPFGRQWVELARARLRPAPAPPPAPPPGAVRTTAPVDLTRLLDPGTAATPFLGRADDLALLRRWCTGGGVSVLLLTGGPGTGKSRLARELARYLRDDGWRYTAGTAPRPGGAGVLVLVDRADVYPERVGAALGLTGERPLRVLVVARAAGEWWSDLRDVLPAEVPAHELGPLDPDDTAEHLRAMTAELGRRIDPATARSSRPVPEGLGEDPTPLALGIRAAWLLLGSGSGPVLDALVDRERRYAEQSAVRAEITFGTPDRLDAYLAAAQLYGASAATEARLLAGAAGGPEGADPETARQIAFWLHQLYPGGGGRYWSMLPSMLRYRLAVPAARREPALITALSQVSAQQAGRALEVLVPACRRHPDLAATLWSAATRSPALCSAVLDRDGGATPELLDLARETMAGPETSVAVLRAIADGVPRTATLFAGQTAEMARRLATSYERLASASAPHQSALADAAHEIGLIWERDGDLDNALAAAEYEVERRRRLVSAAHGSDAPTAELARALTTYAVRLDRAGRPVQGQTAVAEALGLLDRLGADPSTAADHAYALVQQARLLGQLRRAEEAADAAREAVVRYRDLDAGGIERHDAGRHEGGLADALLVEAAQARALDQLERAIGSGAEAVQLYDQLATADPRRRGRLAYACAAYGMDLGDFGSHAAGVAQLERAAALYRDLAGGELGHAAAQLGRGTLLADLERFDAAADAFGEAAAVYRAEHDPAALAGALALRAEVTAAAGRLDEAVTLMTESCGLRDRLHGDDPLDAAIRRDLADGYAALARLHERRGDAPAAHRARLRARLLTGDGG